MLSDKVPSEGNSFHRHLPTEPDKNADKPPLFVAFATKRARKGVSSVIFCLFCCLLSSYAYVLIW